MIKNCNFKLNFYRESARDRALWYKEINRGNQPRDKFPRELNVVRKPIEIENWTVKRKEKSASSDDKKPDVTAEITGVASGDLSIGMAKSELPDV